MHRIFLPISKSIANRWLMLQALHGDGLMTVSDSMPDDVLILHRALTTLKTLKTSETSKTLSTLHINVGNCGTAMRFLTAYCAQLEGQTTILDGVERMQHRPIGQLVDALRSIGAQIEYIGEEGFPPLRIKGCILDTYRIVTLNHPQSTQFISALLLIGANVQTNCTSPYISLTRAMIKDKEQGTKNKDKLLTTDQTQVTNLGSLVLAPYSEIERDWSSAAFWYEYVALYGGEITLDGLYRDSLQGDKIVADIFAHLGVHTTYTAKGITLSPQTKFTEDSATSTRRSGGNKSSVENKIDLDFVSEANRSILSCNFSSCPDLYPAVALTCERLGIDLHATGTESLLVKESDRLRAVREHRTDHDHRMAMALLIAGYEVDDTDCISKSYPHFLDQFYCIKSL